MSPEPIELNAPEVKLVTAQTSIKHGIFAREVSLPSEDAIAYLRARDELFQKYKPTTLEQRALVQTLVDAYWRIDRVVNLEINFSSTSRDHHLAQAYLDLNLPFDPEAPRNRKADELAETYAFEHSSLQFSQLNNQEARLRRLIEKTEKRLFTELWARNQMNTLPQPNNEPVPEQVGVAEMMQNEPNLDVVEPESDVETKNFQNEPNSAPKVKVPKFTGRRAQRKRREWIERNAPHLLKTA